MKFDSQSTQLKHVLRRLVLSSLILTLLVWSLGPLSYAAENPAISKEEVVYAVFQPDGSYDPLIVINQFKLDEAREITDYGNYSQVQALDDRIVLDYDADQGLVQFKGQAGYSYYRGELADRELPWQVNFSYQLDGQEVPIEDLTAASGKFNFRLEVTPNPMVDQALREGFVLQLSVELDKDKYKDLETNASLQAEGGSKTLLNWVLVPQADQPALAEFSCQVQDFALPAPKLAAVPLSIDEDSLPKDFIKLEDLLPEASEDQPLAKLSDGVASLHAGSQDLTAGSQQIHEALKQLSEGGANLSSEDNLGKLQEGLEQLKSGATGLTDGLQQYGAGVDQLAQNYPQLLTGLDSLSDGVKLLGEQIPDLQAGLTNLGQGLDQVVYGLGQNLPQGDMGGLSQGFDIQQALQTLDGLSANLQSFAPLMQMDFRPFQNSLSSLASLNLPSPSDFASLQTLMQNLEAAGGPGSSSYRFQQLMNQLASYMPSISDAGEQAKYQATLQELQAVAGGMAQERQALLNGLGRLQNSLQALQQLQSLDFATLSQSLNQLVNLQTTYGPQLAGMSDQLAQQRQALVKLSQNMNQSSLADLRELYKGLQGLQAGYSKLHTGLEAYLDGIQSMSDQMPSLQTGAQEFGQGLDKLAQSGQDLQKGSQDYMQGLTAYAQGLDQYYAGVNDLSQGLSQLSTQYQDFDDGLSQLADGLDEFQAGLADIPEDFAPDLQKLVQDLLPQYEPLSFVSPQNQVDKVQYVMVLPAVAPAKEKEADAEMREEPDTRTFWEKLGDLFQ